MSSPPAEKYYDFRQTLAIVGYSRYEDYLASEHWSNVRKLWLASDYPTTCQGCGAFHFQLHHLTYRRLGHESLRDLIPLCEPCHQLLHAISKRYAIELASFELAIARGGWDR